MLVHAIPHRLPDRAGAAVDIHLGDVISVIAKARVDAVGQLVEEREEYDSSLRAQRDARGQRVGEVLPRGEARVGERGAVLGRVFCDRRARLIPGGTRKSLRRRQLRDTGGQQHAGPTDDERRRDTALAQRL